MGDTGWLVIGLEAKDAARASSYRLCNLHFNSPNAPQGAESREPCHFFLPMASRELRSPIQ